MEFDPKNLSAINNNWFSTRIRYEGSARAEFTNPAGAIEGSSIVNINSAGECRVLIKVEKIDTTEDKFALGSGTVSSGMFLVNGMSNPCRTLIVETDFGTFIAGDRIVHSNFPFGIPAEIELRPLQSTFEVAAKRPAKYWVLPLINFLPDHWSGQYHQELANHPLRLSTWPNLPENLSEHDQILASLSLHRKGGLYTFLLNDEPGFIERMPNYKKRFDLIKRKQSRMITAVMVGPAHIQHVDWNDFSSLFPLDILSILTLATGTPVGAPWIEFRDEKGALVRRTHFCFGAARYQKPSVEIINHHIGNGIGYLTGKILTAADQGQKYLRVAMNHSIGALDHNASLETRFISICRGFETLCRHHGFINQDLSKQLNSSQQLELKNILYQAAAEIGEMQNKETNHELKSVLEAIKSRTRNAGQKEKSFGLAVTDLIRKFDFNDEAVLDAYFSANPHSTGKTWPGILSYYRNSAIHDGCFDWNQRSELYMILRISHHFHDLLIRVLFKTIGYDGPYQSPISPLMQRESVDWVTTSTPAALLGFA